jgi:hypothetical protein
VIKTVRIEHQRRVTVSEQDGHPTKSKTAVTQESTNFYATSFELGFVSPLSLISSATAVGESIQKFFRPSPATVTSNTPLSTKPRRWWCSP